jgi:tRNA nucleotidyltransferase (CCA-adding enzyme)
MDFTKWIGLLLSTPAGTFINAWQAMRSQSMAPEIDAMKDCQQSPKHHPEGDVYIHTAMALDAAAEMKTGDRDHDVLLIFAVLCHDMGKPATAVCDGGKWSHHNHDIAGIDIAAGFLARIGAPELLINQVKELTKLHLAPYQMPEDAKNEAYRRIIRKLTDAGTTVEMLAKVAKADKWGRTTEEARLRVAPDVNAFLAKAKAVEAEDAKAPAVVQGRHLVERGMKPGREFGELLKKCYLLQQERGLADPETILKVVLPAN